MPPEPPQDPRAGDTDSEVRGPEDSAHRPSTDAPPTSGAANPPVAPTAVAPPAKEMRSLGWVLSTNFGEGLPWSFIHQMVTEFLTAIRASNTQVAATSWFHLAVTFKAVWSPAVDLFGRKRTWVIWLQFLLGLGMLVIAAVAPSQRLAIIWVLLAILSIAHATHDIACDGFYLQALDKHGQALFSGARVAAFKTATLVGASALVVLAARTSWFWGFGAAGAIMCLLAPINAAIMPHPPERTLAGQPGTGGRKSAQFWQAYGSFFLQPNAALVLSFMLFYKLGDIMMFAMSRPLLRDIGVDTAQRGVLNAIGPVAQVLGSVLGGAIIARRGLDRCLVPMTFFQNFAIPLYLGMAIFKPSFYGVIPVVVAEQFAAGVGAAAHVVFLMQRCKTAFSASHYALATSVVSVASTVSGVISGPLNDAVGHVAFFAIAFVASWPSLLLVLFVPKVAIEPTG